MRLIGNLPNEAQAQKLSDFLRREGIENRIETLHEIKSGHVVYQIWVPDEDNIDKANESYQRFVSNSQDSCFTPPIHIQVDEVMPKEKPIRKRALTLITGFFVAFCVFVYLINFFQEISLRQSHLSLQAYLMTPIQKELLFDVPPIVDQYERFMIDNHITPTKTMNDLTSDERSQFEAILKAPLWHGIYDWVLLKAKGVDTSSAEGELFIKIRAGEIWRLFSPCLLHRDLLHILFNMIWLWMLGRPVEERLGSIRTLLLILPIGIISNVAQYLMSGFLFLGFSGIITGLAGFIWMREKIAPWEGYPLQRSTILFLVFFVLAMFVLQLLSFFVQLLSSYSFVINIANTAHIAGALTGIVLGRLSCFAWRANK